MADRAALLSAKLSGLVRDLVGPGDRSAVDFPGGAALLADGIAWVLLDRDPIGALGAAMVWADRLGVTDLHILAEAEAGELARRAALFDPAPHLWEVQGRDVQPARPAERPTQPDPEPAVQLAQLLVDSDLEVVVEDGIVRGEVLGLEVARIVHDRTTAGTPISEPVLEVGVGAADRELTGMVHGELPPIDQLARVIDIVRALRRAGAEPHPLNQLAPERWLRSVLVAEPARIGLRRLRSAPPARPRPNLRDRAVAMAIGEDPDGGTVVVACSVGIDLDLVPAAADAREALAPDAPLLLVVPNRDAHPVTRALAARLRAPAEVVTAPTDWRT